MYSSDAKKNRSPGADMRGAEYDRLGKSDPSGGMIKHIFQHMFAIKTATRSFFAAEPADLPLIRCLRLKYRKTHSSPYG